VRGPLNFRVSGGGQIHSRVDQESLEGDALHERADHLGRNGRPCNQRRGLYSRRTGQRDDWFIEARCDCVRRLFKDVYEHFRRRFTQEPRDDAVDAELAPGSLWSTARRTQGIVPDGPISLGARAVSELGRELVLELGTVALAGVFKWEVRIEI